MGFFKRRVDARREFKRRLAEQETLAQREEPDEGVTARKYLPFDKRALVLYQWGFWLAPSWWLFDAGKRYQTDPGQAWEERRETIEKQEAHTALYAVAWFVVLVTAWLWSPSDDVVATVLGGIALFRLVEIALTVLGFVLDQREPRIARSLITIGALALQVALIFAIVIHCFAPDGFLLPEAVAGGDRTAGSPSEFLYLAGTYMTTVGNQYTPVTDLARVLQLAASASGILLVGIVAARAIGLVGDANKIAAGMEARVATLERADATRTSVSNSSPTRTRPLP